MGILDSAPGYGDLSGYQNPLDFNASPIGTNYDWESFSRGTDWNQTPSIQESPNRWGDAARAAANWLNSKNSGSRTPYTSAARKRQQQQQYGSSPGGFQVSPEVSVIQQSAQPRKITSTTTGGSSGGGLFGSIGGLAGTVGTAAGIFGPLGAPIGAGIGGLIDMARG